MTSPSQRKLDPPKRAIRDIDDAGIARILAHPLRLRILSYMEGRRASPKEMALALDVALEGFSYHVRMLHQAGFLTLVERRPVRGAIQHYYELAPQRPQISDDLWAELPGHVRAAIAGATFDTFAKSAAAALMDGGFEHEDTVMVRQPMMLDAEGFRAVNAVIHDLLEQVSTIESDARARIARGESERIPSTLVTMLYQASLDAGVVAPVKDEKQPAGRAGGRGARSGAAAGNGRG